MAAPTFNIQDLIAPVGRQNPYPFTYPTLAQQAPARAVAQPGARAVRPQPAAAAAQPQPSAPSPSANLKTALTSKVPIPVPPQRQV